MWGNAGETREGSGVTGKVEDIVETERGVFVGEIRSAVTPCTEIGVVEDEATAMAHERVVDAAERVRMNVVDDTAIPAAVM